MQNPDDYPRKFLDLDDCDLSPIFLAAKTLLRAEEQAIRRNATDPAGARYLLIEPRRVFRKAIEPFRAESFLGGGIDAAKAMRFFLEAANCSEGQSAVASLRAAIDLLRPHQTDHLTAVSHVTLKDVERVVREPAKKTIINRMSDCRRDGIVVPEAMKTGGTSEDLYPYTTLRLWLIAQFGPPKYRLGDFLPEDVGDFWKARKSVQ